MLGQVSRPPIPLIIWPEFLGVTMKLGFTREEHGEEAAFPGGDPPSQLIKLFNADAPKKQPSFRLSSPSLYFGFRNLYQCEPLASHPPTAG